MWWFTLAGFALAGLPKPTTICNDVFDPSRIIDITTSGKQGCNPIGTVLPVDSGAISSFCFVDGSLSNNTLRLTTKFPFLIRKISLPPIDANSTSPVSIRVSSSLGAGEVQYYTSPSDRDNGLSWTNLKPLGDTFSFPAGLEFTSLSIWPTSGDREPGGPKVKLGFNVQLEGCWREQIGEVRYVYKSSVESIKTSHGTLTSFERKIVSVIAQLSHEDKNRFIAHVIPEMGGNLTVAVNVLPDNDPSSIPVDLLVEKIATDGNIITTLKQMQEDITDTNNQVCFNKVCPDNSLCVHGVCITKGGIESFTAGNKTTNLVNVRGLMLSARGLESMEPRPVDTNRFLIPGIIVGSVFVIIVGIVLWRTGKSTETRRHHSRRR